ncbi:hypothetical protein K466DRAFT_492258 [Polyporus arcularius HHB13444]|uniref:F-box domain-containing protein n=1 Tax=Polyporus arcularius HHB13444 TaxID=1314778 RepID=A0A5C3PCM6_9APHY|nr:hypothetical protein K466DRAFT_492258 [Polyporus arcularius HHB13444]
MTSLPPELVIAVLVNLDFRTILHCRQVCATWKDLVDRDTRMQYTVELGAAGMEDGPPSNLTPSARLALLRERQAAWRRLAWRSELTFPMGFGPWELQDLNLVLQQLPSAIRGIKAKKWEIPDVGMDMRDFSMDPAQDLLVVVEHTMVGVCCLYLKSLLTGAPHPAAVGSAVLRHQTFLRPHMYIIQIAGDHLGTLLLSRTPGDPSELLIWNWRTGHCRLVRGQHFSDSSFAFLSPRYLLLCPFGNEESDGPDNAQYANSRRSPRILVLDMDFAPHEPVQLKNIEYMCDFLYPKLGPTCRVVGMTIRSAPAPHWQPHPSLQVPFSVDQEERLFVVSLYVAEKGQRRIRSLVSLIPSSTFFYSLSPIPFGTTRHTFTWAEWGPKGSRFYVTPSEVTIVWICYVYGMSFVFLSRDGSQQIVTLLDFNQRDIRRAGLEKEPLSQHAELVTQATTFADRDIFEDVVETSLPYRETRMASFDEEREGWIDAAMIDEDSLILVSSVSHLF